MGRNEDEGSQVARKRFRWAEFKEGLNDPVSWAFVGALAILWYCGRIVTVSLVLAAACVNCYHSGEFTLRWIFLGSSSESSEQENEDPSLSEEPGKATIQEPLNDGPPGARLEAERDQGQNERKDAPESNNESSAEATALVADSPGEALGMEEVDDQLLRLFAPAVSDDKKGRNGPNSLRNGERGPQRAAKQQLDRLLKCINVIEGSSASSASAQVSSKTPLQAKLQKKLGSRGRGRPADPSQAPASGEDPLGDESKIEELLRELGESPQEASKSSSWITPQKKPNRRKAQDREKNSKSVPEGSQQTSPSNLGTADKSSSSPESSEDSPQDQHEENRVPVMNVTDVADEHSQGPVSSEWSVATSRKKKTRKVATAKSPKNETSTDDDCRATTSSTSPNAPGSSDKASAVAAESHTDDEEVADEDGDEDDDWEWQCPQGTRLEPYRSTSDMLCSSCGKRWPKGTFFLWSSKSKWASCEDCVRAAAEQHFPDDDKEEQSQPVSDSDVPDASGMSASDLVDWFHSREADCVLHHCMDLIDKKSVEDVAPETLAQQAISAAMGDR